MSNNKNASNLCGREYRGGKVNLLGTSAEGVARRDCHHGTCRNVDVRERLLRQITIGLLLRRQEALVLYLSDVCVLDTNDGHRGGIGFRVFFEIR